MVKLAFLPCGVTVGTTDFGSVGTGSIPVTATNFIIMEKDNYTSIESRVASAILQRRIASIGIDGKEYDIAPPTLATLILVSEIVATLPVVDKSKVEPENRLYSALHNARHYKRIGELIGVLILGAKNVTATEMIEVTTRKFFGLIRRKKQIPRTYNRAVELGESIMMNVRPSLIYELIIKLLQQNEITIFFAITTSLSAANIIQPTKAEVVNE